MNADQDRRGENERGASGEAGARKAMREAERRGGGRGWGAALLTQHRPASLRVSHSPGTHFRHAQRFVCAAHNGSCSRVREGEGERGAGPGAVAARRPHGQRNGLRVFSLDSKLGSYAT